MNRDPTVRQSAMRKHYDMVANIELHEGKTFLYPVLGLVSRKPRKLFGPVKPFLVHLYRKAEKCMRLKLLK